MIYSFEIKKMPPIQAVSISFKGEYCDIGKYIGTLYKAIRGRATGAPFCCYYEPGNLENTEIELCVPFIGTIAGNDVTVKQLPSTNTLCTRHIGSYETLNQAYQQILKYAKENGYKLLSPSREIYVKGPGRFLKGNPQNYITDIVIPIS